MHSPTKGEQYALCDQQRGKHSSLVMESEQAFRK